MVSEVSNWDQCNKKIFTKKEPKKETKAEGGGEAGSKVWNERLEGERKSHRLKEANEYSREAS